MDRRAFLTLLLPAATAAAQDSSPTSSPPSLSTLLESTYWMPDAAQTLLILGGKQAKLLPEASEPSEESNYRQYYERTRTETLKGLGAPPPRGYSLSAVGAVFGRKVVRLGPLACLAPTQRRVLNATPGPPRFDASSDKDSIRPLIQALDDKQLKKLLSEEGLGRADLPERLLPLFDAIQTGPLWLKRELTDPPFLALAGEGLQNLRLRVSLASTLLALKGYESLGFLVFHGRTVSPQSLFSSPGLLRVSPPDTVAPPPVPGEHLGHYLVRSVPATPQPSMLAPENLTRRISLDGISTLEKLAERVGQAEGLSLILPPPLSSWSVEWRGSPEVRTGDVIRAITASTTGTFRECQGVYLLVDAMDPLAPRLEKLTHWIEQGALAKLKANPREFLPLEWGRFEPTDTYPIPRALQERLQDADQFDGLRFPVDQFPDQKLLTRLLAPHYASKPEFAPTHISLRMSWVAYLVVPGVGAAFLEQLFMLGRKRPARRVPLTLKATWPILKVTTPAEAKKALVWAKQQGASGVVIDGPVEAIKAAIATRTLPVRALHHLWGTLPIDSEALKERTFENATAACLSPTHPAAVGLAAERLNRLTTLPGLDGVLIRDAAPPGYRYDSNDWNGRTPLGYTAHNQKSFLRLHQRDIFDLAPRILYYPLRSYTPWVRPEDQTAWGTWRVEQLHAALNKLRPTSTNNEGCPCWLEGGYCQRDENTQHLGGSPLPGWLVRWTERKVDTPLWQLSYSATEKVIGSARETGPTPWLLLPIPAGTTRATFEEHLGRLESELGDGWQGRYIDLSAHSLTEAQELLSGA